MRWVVCQKYKNEGVTYKARLVAQGFEEENLDEYARIRQPVERGELPCSIITYSWK